MCEMYGSLLQIKTLFKTLLSSYTVISYTGQDYFHLETFFCGKIVMYWKDHETIMSFFF